MADPQQGMRFGEYLRALRERACITQDELASRAGVHVNTVRRAEQAAKPGDQGASGRSLTRLARAFQQTPQGLVTGWDRSSPTPLPPDMPPELPPGMPRGPRRRPGRGTAGARRKVGVYMHPELDERMTAIANRFIGDYKSKVYSAAVRAFLELSPQQQAQWIKMEATAEVEDALGMRRS